MCILLLIMDLIIVTFQTLELACNACDALDRSNEFLEVLRYVLAIGNYLNSGTAKGNAYGFQLKYLPQVMLSFLVVVTFVIIYNVAGRISW